MLHFDSDYMEGAHPRILEQLSRINYEKNAGYGTDERSEQARQKIRAACGAPEAEVFFLAGGTQTNAAVIGSLLRPFEGVISADTGHIATHEAGAIEYTRHKVLTLPAVDGKVSAESVDAFMKVFTEDVNNEHEVAPAMVYISQPTEIGTVYSREELFALRAVCDRYGLKLYADGARLGYGLACEAADFTLKDMSAACHAFYIGGTKVGALFGEAVVFPEKGLIPRFFTMIKQKGALLAKGWIPAVEFDVLFTDDLYLEISKHAVSLAMKLKKGLVGKGFPLFIDSPTNQQFFIVPDEALEQIREKVSFSFWEKPDDRHTVIRFVTSWATNEKDIDELLSLLPG